MGVKGVKTSPWICVCISMIAALIAYSQDMIDIGFLLAVIGGVGGIICNTIRVII